MSAVVHLVDAHKESDHKFNSRKLHRNTEGESMYVEDNPGYP